MPRLNAKREDWYTVGELFATYPDLMRALRAVYDVHPQPGNETMLRVPERASELIKMIAMQWASHQGKSIDLFPYRGFAVLFSWVKYRKDSKRADYDAPRST